MARMAGSQRIWDKTPKLDRFFLRLPLNFFFTLKLLSWVSGCTPNFIISPCQILLLSHCLVSRVWYYDLPGRWLDGRVTQWTRNFTGHLMYQDHICRFRPRGCEAATIRVGMERNIGIITSVGEIVDQAGDASELRQD